MTEGELEERMGELTSSLGDILRETAPQKAGLRLRIEATLDENTVPIVKAAWSSSYPSRKKRRTGLIFGFIAGVIVAQTVLLYWVY